MSYAEFLERKTVTAPMTGIAKPPKLSAHLFPFQADITRWGLKRGRAAIFADCGMGKTAVQLEWARVVAKKQGPVLILAPLAVAQQTVREGEKFGIPLAYERSMPASVKGITITNYEMLPHFDTEKFAGVVIDESSILKSYDGATRTAIIDAFAKTPFRLACTATPAPNDYMELGNHAEFVGAMSRVEMLSMFFVHDGGETQKWRLKGHAHQDFWRWLASWSVMIRKPSDLGYDDDAFVLPKLTMHEHVIDVDRPTPGMLFALEAATLQERIAARRESIAERTNLCYKIINEDQRTNARIQLSILREEQNKTPSSGDCLVHSQQGENRQSCAKGLHACVLPSESRQVSSDSAATGQIQRHSSGAIRKRSRSKKKSEETSKGMAGEESEETQSAASADLRDQSRGLRGHASGPDESLRDLRSLKYEQSKDVSAGGSLSQDRPSSRAAVLGLQHRIGQVQGQHRQSDVGDYVPPTKWIVWCALNDEQDELERLFGDDCISIYGSLSSEEKERRLCAWLDGPIPILISKISIIGFGVNLQICHKAAFVGLSDSWEGFYQATRRIWRFGQTVPVDIHVIIAGNEGAVLRNIKAKDAASSVMADSIVSYMRAEMQKNIHTGTTRMINQYERDKVTGPNFEMHLGDSVEIMRDIPSDSIHYSIFSPPFSSLYTYSASDRDMGNCKNQTEFLTHFGYLVKDLYRVTMPGRLLSFHCMNLPTSKTHHGYIGIRHFRGDLIRLFEQEGWIFHSEVCIWKDPVTAMQRTKALGLLYKQLKKDSAMSRQGIPDYLVTMRKPGENPERVTHTESDFPVGVWQNYASPVWMDINPSDTLQFRSAREHADERHICPLQLQVIQRGIELWSNPGDTVLSPFAGIGSEGYVALQNGRRFIGCELKRSYWQAACENLRHAKRSMGDLFSDIPAEEAKEQP